MKSMPLILMIALSPISFADTINAEDFRALAYKCASNISFDTLHAIVKTESSFNPFAIGVVNGSIKQPKTLQNALLSVQQLEKEGKNYSLGLGQINKANFSRLNLNAEQLFDPCTNLQATSKILSECYMQAKGSEGQRLEKTLSCYFSGNEVQGLKLGYVDQVKSNAQTFIPSISKLQQQSLKEDFVVSVEKTKNGLIF